MSIHNLLYFVEKLTEILQFLVGNRSSLVVLYWLAGQCGQCGQCSQSILAAVQRTIQAHRTRPISDQSVVLLQPAASQQLSSPVWHKKSWEVMEDKWGGLTDTPHRPHQSYPVKDLQE